MAPAELRRFSQRFSARAMFDETSRSYRDAGLAYLTLDEDQAFDRLMRDQSLLRLPLVRMGTHVSVGVDERAWRDWLSRVD
jgi:arsenate reductase-like glutaredoxin family protein